MKTLRLSLLAACSGWLLASRLLAQDISTVNYGFASGQEGYANSFIGAYAGLYTTMSGSGNSFIGCNAGKKNTIGQQNSFVGYNAGFNNNTGKYNSFLGYSAGFKNIGDRNTFLGYSAGYTNTSGVANCFVGAYAGYLNTGFSNCFLGAYAGYTNSTGTNNSLVGRDAGYATTTGSYNSMLGYGAGYKNTTGSNNVFIGAYSNASSSGLANAGAIGHRSYVTASNSLVLGSINGQNGATASTKVGIGTTAPAYLLQVNGTAAKPGSGSWTVASDERLKQDIFEFKDGLAVVSQIKPVWFHYNGKAGMPKQKQYIGILAQAMQKIAPYTVGEFTHQDSTGKTEKYLDYDPNALSYILVNAAKELKAENEAQQQQLVEKEQQIAALETRLARLEAMLLKRAPESTSVARLYQNEPNPYTKTTVIKYVVPHTATSVQLKVFSVTGQQVYSQELSVKGEGQVELSHSAFASGTYVYHLIVDGQSVDAKKMMLTR